jgi:hypothetical protein
LVVIVGTESGLNMTSTSSSVLFWHDPIKRNMATAKVTAAGYKIFLSLLFLSNNVVTQSSKKVI